MAGVRLLALTKRYGENAAAVRDLTLEIRHGELVSLLGPSGCGKTTTLRLIAGFLAPDAGEIWLGDRRLSAAGEAVPPERRGMSMLFQSYAVWPHKTVAENVTYGLKFRAWPGRSGPDDSGRPSRSSGSRGSPTATRGSSPAVSSSVSRSRGP